MLETRALAEEQMDAEDLDPAIYALGVRNPQGLVLDKSTGTIYETEHGPMGGDEAYEPLRERVRNLDGVVMVIGDAETGKTTLARMLLRDAVKHGRTVAYIDGDVAAATVGPIVKATRFPIRKYSASTRARNRFGVTDKKVAAGRPWNRPNALQANVSSNTAMALFSANGTATAKG